MTGFYTVKAGDTLWGISKRYNTTVDELVKLNSLYGNKKHKLSIGQKIKLKVDVVENIETTLTIKMYDLAWEKLPKAKLLLEYDGKTHVVICDENGVAQNIQIMRATKGLKVSFYNIKKQYEVIAHHKRLPIGNKVLKLSSRAIVVKGQTYSTEGIQRQVAKTIERVLKTNSQKDNANSKKESPQGISPDNPNKNQGQTNSKKEVFETRLDNGVPATVVAVVYTEENLYLHPDNEKYRKAIIAAAKKYNLLPQALAAKINAEAAKVPKTEEWNSGSKAGSTTASGLTQFLRDSWAEICTASKYSNTLVQQHVIKNKLIPNFKADVKVKDMNTDLKKKLLTLAINPDFSIDAGAAYARNNINALTNKYPKVAQLDPTDLAKITYLAHHDGLEGLYKLLNNSISKSWEKLAEQIGNGRDYQYYTKNFSDSSAAYRWWLCSYTDKRINVNRFTVQPKDGGKFKEPHTMEEIIVSIGGKTLVQPKDGGQSASPTQNDNITIIIVSMQANVIKPNQHYMIKSKYGNKAHNTDNKGYETIKAQKGDKLDIVVDNKVISTIIAEQDKQEYKIDFPQSAQQEAKTEASDALNFGEWRNPLNGICQIRRFGYNSLPLIANSKTFDANNLKNATTIASRFCKNSYRNSGVHQGIDIEADNGTNVYPVCVGKIIKTIDNYPGYGKTVILECSVDDLPANKKALVKDKNQKKIYFIYAHLNSIQVKAPTDIGDITTILGTTGNTGNAGAMTSIEQGAHLHFEVRTEVDKSMGKSGMNYRLDPFPWIDDCKTIENGVNLKR